MNSEYKEKIQKYFEDHREEYLADLKKLVDIESTAGEAGPGKPYGEGPAKVLEAAVELAEGYGLKALNKEHYGLVMLPDDEERRIDVLGHLDVVPASPESWTKTAPFDMKVIDGIAYGRGVADDKGPTLAAIYALRAVKDLGLNAKGVRIFMGCCEETGAQDTEVYFKEYGKPDTAVTPDANWPVVNLEKGGMAGFITDKIAEDAASCEESCGCSGTACILSIHGGKALNIICGLTTARICGIEADTASRIAGLVQEATGVTFTVTEEEAPDILTVTAEGLSAHASTPDLGNNSNTAMLRFLAALPFDETARGTKIVKD
ncbi:MAG: M20/M25/M40 family metallo-hydrolase, partial [Lachnospiraceae bacterium]|nr:M20/M25/M40 family metallo-hydrolase [Lachnospiraceae bacterium]